MNFMAWQAIIVDKLLGGMTNGFFIECGAFDGEFLSNSLFFELKRNWCQFHQRFFARIFCTKFGTQNSNAVFCV